MQHYSAYSGRRRADRKRRKKHERKSRAGSLGIRLAICAALFGAASVLRLLFPAEAARLGEKLNSVCDIRSAFTVLGEGISGKRDFTEALGDAYRYVFVPDRQEPEIEVMAEETDAGLPSEETPVLPAFAEGEADLREIPAVPVEGKVVRSYGYNAENTAKTFSYATEVETKWGTPVCSMLTGTVTATGASKTKGRYIVVSSDGAETEYSGLGEILAESGDEVSAGERIASAGDCPVRVELITDTGYTDPERYVTWS